MPVKMAQPASTPAEQRRAPADGHPIPKLAPRLPEAAGISHRRPVRRHGERHLAAERGELDTLADEAEIARYMRLLGGMDQEPSELQAADAARARCRSGERIA